MRIVTGAKPFIDIDAYGGILAYAELLQKQGVDAKAASSSILNGSITPTILSWSGPLDLSYAPAPDDTFTLIDVANFDFLDKMVDINRVDEIIDHHPGFENYWHEKIGDKAQFEMVGAACTLVYERWEQAGRLNEMSQTSARALVCGILDNTLNFGAKLTSRRDKDAYEALLTIAKLPKNWTSLYFTECQEAMLSDIPKAIQNDYKPMSLPGWVGQTAGGQLGVWDAKDLLNQHMPEIKKVMAASGLPWFMNIIAIGEGRSYFVSDDPAMREWLSELLGLSFNSDFAVADRMWLRKEITKEAMNKEAIIS